MDEIEDLQKLVGHLQEERDTLKKKVEALEIEARALDNAITAHKNRGFLLEDRIRSAVEVLTKAVRTT